MKEEITEQDPLSINDLTGDKNIKVEDLKHKPSDIAIDPLNTDQESSKTFKKGKKRKRVSVYHCDQCEYTGSSSALRYHKKSKHKGIRYPWDQCEYIALGEVKLLSHKKAYHEEAKNMEIKNIFTCEFCGFKGSEEGIRVHKKQKHLKIPCDQCDYTAI